LKEERKMDSVLRPKTVFEKRRKSAGKKRPILSIHGPGEGAGGGRKRA